MQWRLFLVNAVGVVTMQASLVELNALNCFFFKLFFKELLQAALLQLAYFLHTLLTESARRVRKWRYQLWWAARDNTPNKGKLTATRRQLWKQVSNRTNTNSHIIPNMIGALVYSTNWLHKIRQCAEKSLITRPTKNKYLGRLWIVRCIRPTKIQVTGLFHTKQTIYYKQQHVWMRGKPISEMSQI